MTLHQAIEKLNACSIPGIFEQNGDDIVWRYEVCAHGPAHLVSSSAMRALAIAEHYLSNNVIIGPTIIRNSGNPDFRMSLKRDLW